MPFGSYYPDSAPEINPDLSDDSILIHREIFSDPVFKDEPASMRGAFIILAVRGRVVRASIPDLSRAWGVHERKAAQMVRKMERLGLISIAGEGRCRLICIESDMVRTCGFHIMSSARYPKGAGGAKWRGGSMPKPTRDRVLKRDQHTCQYCGAVGVTLHVDHVKPVSRGGTDALSNLKAACAPCNLSKGSKLLAEWRPVQ